MDELYVVVTEGASSGNTLCHGWDSLETAIKDELFGTSDVGLFTHEQLQIWAGIKLSLEDPDNWLQYNEELVSIEILKPEPLLILHINWEAK